MCFNVSHFRSSLHTKTSFPINFITHSIITCLYTTVSRRSITFIFTHLLIITSSPHRHHHRHILWFHVTTTSSYRIITIARLRSSKLMYHSIIFNTVASLYTTFTYSISTITSFTYFIHHNHIPAYIIVRLSTSTCMSMGCVHTHWISYIHTVLRQLACVVSIS